MEWVNKLNIQIYQKGYDFYGLNGHINLLKEIINKENMEKIIPFKILPKGLYNFKQIKEKINSFNHKNKNKRIIIDNSYHVLIIPIEKFQEIEQLLEPFKRNVNSSYGCIMFCENPLVTYNKIIQINNNNQLICV